MKSKFEETYEKMIEGSISDQLKREDRLKSHTSSYYTASSIVLVAETTIFVNFSDYFYRVSDVFWYTVLIILLLQLLMIPLCYLLLFPGIRVNYGSPKDICKWYFDNYDELESNEENPTKAKETKQEILRVLSNMHNTRFESIKKDVDKGYLKLRLVYIASLSLICAFVLMTVFCCFFI